jgi:shikimate 5-dehydrogenase
MNFNAAALTPAPSIAVVPDGAGGAAHAAQWPAASALARSSRREIVVRNLEFSFPCRYAELKITSKRWFHRRDAEMQRRDW